MVRSQENDHVKSLAVLEGKYRHHSNHCDRRGSRCAEFGRRRAERIISSATLGLLALIAVSLLRNRGASDQLQQTLQETRSQLQATLAGIQKPSASQIVTPYKDFVSEIDERLSLAKEVWVLSRTCTRLWELYNAPFVRC